jgi:protein SCO1
VKLWRVAFLLLAVVLLPSPVRAASDFGIGVTERLGETLPLDVPFVDHRGREVVLADYFASKRPVLLVFGYHTCPMLCSLIQSAVVDALKNTEWTVGREFDVVVISIDPKDTPVVAAARRASIVERYLRERTSVSESDGDSGWHYLVGSEASIRRVTEAAGYRFEYDAEHEQYGHPAVILLLTPDGRVARYLYGVEYSPSDVRFGLLEASRGHSVSTIDRILLYCVHYDPLGGRYRIVASRVIQVGAALIAALLGGLLSILWLRDRRRMRSGGRGVSATARKALGANLDRGADAAR